MARTFSLLELQVSKSSVNCLVSAALKCFLTCDDLWGFPTSSCLTFLSTLNPPGCCYRYCCLLVLLLLLLFVQSVLPAPQIVSDVACFDCCTFFIWQEVVKAHFSGCLMACGNPPLVSRPKGKYLGT